MTEQTLAMSTARGCAVTTEVYVSAASFSRTVSVSQAGRHSAVKPNACAVRSTASTVCFVVCPLVKSSVAA